MNNTEMYFTFELWTTYYIPLILLGLIGLFLAFLFICSKIADIFEKRMTKEETDEQRNH